MSIAKETLSSVCYLVLDKIPQGTSVSLVKFGITLLSEVQAACERESQLSEPSKTLNMVHEDGGRESCAGSIDFSFVNTKSAVHLLERMSERPLAPGLPCVQASPTQSDDLSMARSIRASATTLPSVQASPTQSDAVSMAGPIRASATTSPSNQSSAKMPQPFSHQSDDESEGDGTLTSELPMKRQGDSLAGPMRTPRKLDINCYARLTMKMSGLPHVCQKLYDECYALAPLATDGGIVSFSIIVRDDSSNESSIACPVVPVAQNSSKRKRSDVEPDTKTVKTFTAFPWDDLQFSSYAHDVLAFAFKLIYTMHALFGIYWTSSLELPGSFLTEVRCDHLVSHIKLSSGVRVDYYCFPFWFLDLLKKYDATQAKDRPKFFFCDKTKTFANFPHSLSESIKKTSKSGLNLITSFKTFEKFFSDMGVSILRSSETEAKSTLLSQLGAYYEHYIRAGELPLWFAHLCIPALLALDKDR